MRIASFLSERPHWTLSGSLDVILEALLDDVAPGASSEVLAGLGFATFDELDAREKTELGRWSDELKRRVAVCTASWRTSEASALIVRRSIGEPAKDLRQDLLELIERAPSLSPRIELAHSNQVAEEMAHRGDISASNRFRRALLRKYRGETKGPLRAQLLEEKVRLISHEVRHFRTLAWGVVHWLTTWRALALKNAGLPERDRIRLRLMLTIRYPALLHEWGQNLLATELRTSLRGRLGRGVAALLRRVRVSTMRRSERHYRAIAANEFGAGFRGLAMLRVAELALLTRGWSPEIDELIGHARWRTRPGWQATDEGDEFQYVNIQEGVRLLILGNLPKARTVLWKTFRYFAARHDVSGRAQSLLYLGAVEIALGGPKRAKRLLQAVHIVKRRNR